MAICKLPLLAQSREFPHHLEETAVSRTHYSEDLPRIYSEQDQAVAPGSSCVF